MQCIKEKKQKKEVEKELMRISAIIRFELLSAIISPDLLLCESDKARGWNLNFDNGEFHYFSTISLSSTIQFPPLTSRQLNVKKKTVREPVYLFTMSSK